MIPWDPTFISEFISLCHYSLRIIDDRQSSSASEFRCLRRMNLALLSAHLEINHEGTARYRAFIFLQFHGLGRPPSVWTRYGGQRRIRCSKYQTDASHPRKKSDENARVRACGEEISIRCHLSNIHLLLFRLHVNQMTLITRKTWSGPVWFLRKHLSSRRSQVSRAIVLHLPTRPPQIFAT